jgi:enoyl-CoA hydratase/carnithine racemase
MSESTVLLERRGGVAILTLNRPDRMNAITLEMLERLGEHLAALDRDESVRAIVLTGAGRGFCSGMDLKEAAAGRGIGGSGVLSPTGGGGHLSTRELVTVTLHRIDVPVICALNGAAAGYGFDLALGCDLRLMSDRAKLVPGFAKRGIVPESGGTWFLPRLVGWAKACEIGFLGEEIPAERALTLGLVNRVVPDAELRAEALRVAEQIAANAPLAIRAMKRLFRHGLSEDFESHSHHVLMQLLLLFRSSDFQEGVKAFLEKRDPEFEGR